MKLKPRRKLFARGLKTCSNCGKSTLSGNFCTECGDMLGIASIELESRICHYCNEEIPDRKYCTFCGERKPYDFELKNFHELVEREREKCDEVLDNLSDECEPEVAEDDEYEMRSER